MSAEVPSCPCGESHESGDQSPISNVREKDMLLPMANISRIMRKSLTRNGKITKGAKDAMQDCVTEFITFITSEVSDRMLKEKRKTINGDDILRAMTILGFEDYINPLRLYLKKYRLIEGDSQFLLGAEISALQDGNLPGSSMDGDTMILQQDSFIEGMGYMNTQGDDKFLRGAESSGMRDAGGLQGGNLAGPSMQGNMKRLQQDSFIEGMGYMNTLGDGKFLRGAESSGTGDAGGLQGGNLAGPSMQGDMKMLQQDSFIEGMGYMNTQRDGKFLRGAESSSTRDAGGLQGGNLAGPSMQGDMKMLQQHSFTEGMAYMNTQVLGK